MKIKKIILTAVLLSAVSLTSCSLSDMRNSTDDTQQTLITPENSPVTELRISAPETTGVSENTVISETVTTTSNTSQDTDDIDFYSCRDEYLSRIDNCVNTMEKTTGLNVVVSEDNKIAESDPFWSAMLEKSGEINVNPVAVASSVGISLGELNNTSISETDFIPFVYEPVFGNSKKYEGLTPEQIIAVIVEETFNIPSKTVITEYIEEENLVCAYVMTNTSDFDTNICALYAYVDDNRITQIGIETFIHEYYDIRTNTNAVKRSVPTEDNFTSNNIAYIHKKMCDSAATVMSTGYYYQRSSAKFITTDDSVSYFQKNQHISAAHYVSWFYLS